MGIIKTRIEWGSVVFIYLALSNCYRLTFYTLMEQTGEILHN